MRINCEDLEEILREDAWSHGRQAWNEDKMVISLLYQKVPSWSKYSRISCPSKCYLSGDILSHQERWTLAVFPAPLPESPNIQSLRWWSYYNNLVTLYPPCGGVDMVGLSYIQCGMAERLSQNATLHNRHECRATRNSMCTGNNVPRGEKPPY